jgi:hypothetical protein
MATKPSDTFTWATDANFSSGPAAGQPTKVSPPGFPAVVQGHVPGAAMAAEFENLIKNILGQWVNNWLLLGSSAGAANAHIVEADASGNTKVQGILGDLRRLVLTPARLTIVAADINIRELDGTDGPVCSFYRIDNSGASAVQTITVRTTNVESGELVLFVFDETNGSDAVAIATETGGGNPLYQLDPSPAVSSDWVLIAFDDDAGGWRVAAAGNT